jgi:hypothetical protein
MNAHYEEVLEDLRQMKADAEAGILAIERLMSRTQVTAPTVAEPRITANPVGPAEGHDDASVPQRVVQFLESQPGKSFTIADIVQGVGIEKVQTLRGALGRLVKSGKIGRHGRGRYRAPRPKTQPDSEA